MWFYGPLEDKMKARIDKWINLPLYKGGRLILAQVVLNSLPVYYFSILKAPNAVIVAMEKLIRDFIWRGGTQKKGSRKWTSLPQQRGGLDVGSLKQRNKALLLKWIWRFSHEDSGLWHKVIAAIYGLKAHGWSTRTAKDTARARPWLIFDKNRQGFMNFVTFKASNGGRMRFWEDVWIDASPSIFSLSRFLWPL